MAKLKNEETTETPAPEFTEPVATIPVEIVFTVRDPNTGELVSSEAEFKKPEENKK
jgi:hypothetical protein